VKDPEALPPPSLGISVTLVENSIAAFAEIPPKTPTIIQSDNTTAMHFFITFIFVKLLPYISNLY